MAISDLNIEMRMTRVFSNVVQCPEKYTTHTDNEEALSQKKNVIGYGMHNDSRAFLKGLVFWPPTRGAVPVLVELSSPLNTKVH
jgi:hypothetical protein